MNVDGTNQRRLTDNTADDDDPVWSPDGRQIAFTSRGNENSEIYVMSADGHGQMNLTNSPAGYDESAAWSPDGTKITFASSSGTGHRQIYVMSAEGHGQTNLTSNNFYDEHDPVWSPDGTRIAFVSNRVGDLAIHVMNADGTGRTRLSKRRSGRADLVAGRCPARVRLQP